MKLNLNSLRSKVDAIPKEKATDTDSGAVASDADSAGADSGVRSSAPAGDKPGTVASAVDNTKPVSAGQSYLAARLGLKPKPAEPAPEPKPVESTAVAISEPAVEAEAEPEPEGPDGFRAKLDKLDSMFIIGTGYTTLVIDQARGAIAELMIELKTNPEYGQLLLDSDVRNIVAYAQQVSQAVHTKAVAAKAKSVAKSNKTAAFRGAFDMSGLNKSLVDANQKAASMDINSLAAFDASSIKAKR